MTVQDHGADARRSAAPTRRERQRQATFEEIVTTARALLREHDDVSLRRVAAEMGLTAPALYRYVDSHAELMGMLTRDVFADVVATMGRARDAHPADDPAAQIVAAAGAFRRWALANREEFRLVFASTSTPGEQAAHVEAMRTPFASMEGCVSGVDGVHEFGLFFGEIFGRLAAVHAVPVPGPESLPEGVREGLAAEGVTGVDAGLLWLFERAWARLYGTVTLEVFCHVHPAISATGALFEAAILDIGLDLGLVEEWDRLQPILRG